MRSTLVPALRSSTSFDPAGLGDIGAQEMPDCRQKPPFFFFLSNGHEYCTGTELYCLYIIPIPSHPIQVSNPPTKQASLSRY